ncbi:MAG: insulinase family protein [Alphaproteobacteria bacterium]|jgi:zinc protease|nr:insulinase family protein [Alphaproteobacteria bacterium]
MKQWISGGLAATVLLGGAAFADNASEEWAPETFTLDNGMEVVVLPDHRAPVVTHMVWYKVGAADEAPGRSGIAHLFEHVMFKETDDVADGEFDSIISRLGGQNNAFTSWDYTAYYERVAKQHLGKMMELEAERMTDLIIDEDPEGSFITERDVVKEERRQRVDNNPGVILQEKVLAEFWKGHPYEITVIGRMEEVEALTPQDGIDFYKKYYSPENAILVVAGDVTGEEVKTLAEQHYGVIEPSGLVDGSRKWTDVTPLSETLELTHSDPKVRQPVWYRYFDGTSQKRDREFSLALEVGLEVLGGGNTSLLYVALVEDQKVAVNAGTFAWTGLHDQGPAVIYATPSPGVSMEDLETAVTTEIANLLEAGFSDEDVERVRNSMAAEAIYARDSQQSMANLFGSWLAIGGSIEDLMTYSDDVRAVSTEDALAAVRKTFADGNHYIEAQLLPAEGEL